MPDGSRPPRGAVKPPAPSGVRRAPLALMQAANQAFGVPDDHPYIAASVAWVMTVEPRLALDCMPDPAAVVLHCAMVGRNDKYYAGLLRLFIALKMNN